MLAIRRVTVGRAIFLAWRIVARVAGWSAVVYALYCFAGWDWLRLPFLPLSTMGIAVAFYLGFKNNSAYDRFWEGRKIWGAIVNASRTWAQVVVCYIRPGDAGDDAQELRRALVLRHLAWVNALRLQLRKTSRFFHKPARQTRIRLEKHADHMRNDWDKELSPFVDPRELARVTAQINPATHLVVQQGQILADEVREGKLDLFHQLAMMDVLRELYTLQGKCERIKNTPLPRQYAEYGRIFVNVFVFMVPLGMLDVVGVESHTALAWGVLDTFVPFFVSSVLVGWVFLTMEVIGDASEDPFERSFNDVPMNALSRGIERDLRQIVGEAEVPEAEQAVDGVLY